MAKQKIGTIYEIARELKMSADPGGKALYNHPYSSRIAKDRVFNLAVSPGYWSNHFAKNLRGKKTNTIGVIVHELGSHFIVTALKGIEQVAAESGYEVVITHSQESSAKEISNAQALFDRRVDGLIASLSVNTTSLDHFHAFTDKGIPVILFDRVEKVGDSGMVITDNYRCGYLATEHLIKQGCKRIAIVTSGLRRNVYGQRYKGYRDALKNHEVEFEKNLLVVGDTNEEAGIESARLIAGMKKKPDGLFITNDLVAATCMHELKKTGVRVPEDIAIVGFNNDPIGRFTSPSLTTIDYSGHKIGKAAAANLLDCLSGKTSASQFKTAVIPAELIVRNSSIKKM